MDRAEMLSHFGDMLPGFRLSLVELFARAERHPDSQAE
jgi:hypothetical protein